MTLKTKTTLAASILAVSAIIIVGGGNVFAASTPVPENAPTTYNKDMTDWWDDMVEDLGNDSSKVWTQPEWGDDVYAEIETVNKNTYRITLHGIAAPDDPIKYTIMTTEDGYYKYGPMLEGGTMDSRSYVKTAGDDALRSQPIKPNWLILQDSRTGEGYIGDSDSHCWLATDSWFGGDVVDDWDGSRINYRANPDAYDNCSKPLTPDDVDLDWRNGSYNLHVTGTSTSGSPSFYTPDPDGTTTFQMRINWE